MRNPLEDPRDGDVIQPVARLEFIKLQPHEVLGRAGRVVFYRIGIGGFGNVEMCPLDQWCGDPGIIRWDIVQRGEGPDA